MHKFLGNVFLHACMQSHFGHAQLCNPTDHTLPGSSVHEILRVRVLERIAMPPPGDLPKPKIEPASLTSPALTGRFFTISTTWEAQGFHMSTKELSYFIGLIWASLVAQTVKNPPAMQDSFDPWAGKIPWRSAWQLIPVFLPGESRLTEVPGRLHTVHGVAVRHTWATKHSTLA